jgi:ABC-2 type transport system ATP-binding protein
MPVLDIRDVSVSYGKKQVLDDVSFSVQKGEILGLLGRNGSGKTTVLKVLVGLIKPGSGTLTHGRDLLKSSAAARLMGYCPQENSFLEKLTVKENIEYFGQLYSLPREELRILTKKAVYLLELDEKLDELSTNLSGGQKRRLNIACSIVHSPEILLMDEPSLALDPVSRKNLWQLIKAINRTGTSIIISSNSIEELRELCTHIVALKGGSVVYDGPATAIQNEAMINQIY